MKVTTNLTDALTHCVIVRDCKECPYHKHHKSCRLMLLEDVKGVFDFYDEYFVSVMTMEGEKKIGKNADLEERISRIEDEQVVLSEKIKAIIDSLAMRKYPPASAYDILNYKSQRQEE